MEEFICVSLLKFEAPDVELTGVYIFTHILNVFCRSLFPLKELEWELGSSIWVKAGSWVCKVVRMFWTRGEILILSLVLESTGYMV